IQPSRRVPRAVGRLRLQQPLDAALPVRVGDRDAPSLMERYERLSRRVGVADATIERRPTAVRLLCVEQLTGEFLQRVATHAAPFETEQLIRALFGIDRTMGFQPLAGERDVFVDVGL